MPLPTRSLVLAAALGVFALDPALAQTTPPRRAPSPSPQTGAAATLPNSFDDPAAQSVPTAPLAEQPGGVVTETDAAESALRGVIAQMTDGEIDASLFTPDAGTRLQRQLPTVSPLLQGYGELQTIEAQGAHDGAAQFLVTFDNAATQWLIGLDDTGLIAALLFRPAPAESSEPSAATEN